VSLSSALTSQIHCFNMMSGCRPPAPRRRFTAAFKPGCLRRRQRCTKAGEVGALPGAKGCIPASTTWRAAAQRGELAGLSQRRARAHAARPACEADHRSWNGSSPR